MPTPRKGEKQAGWMTRCIPVLIREGKKRDQAVAICGSMWRRRNGKKRKSKRKK